MAKLQEHQICPICGKNNGCIIGNKDCWCTKVDFPKGLLDMVPEDKKRKACICKNCVDKYVKKHGVDKE